MKLIITESRIEQIIQKSLSIVFNGFEDITWSWADFNCGWGVCCDIYAVGFTLPDSDHDDYLFKLVNIKYYDDDGDYPKELMDELPEPCYDLPDITESRFDTLWLGDELIDELINMFGNYDVCDKSFLNIVNQKYGTTASHIG